MSITNLQIADSAVAVTPGDSTELSPGILFVGVGGDVAVQTLAGETVTFKNIADGSYLYTMVVKVLSTGTTAKNILIAR